MTLSHSEAVHVSGELKDALKAQIGSGALHCYPVYAERDGYDGKTNFVRVEVSTREDACIARDVVGNLGYADNIQVMALDMPVADHDVFAGGHEPLFVAQSPAAAAAFSINNL